MLKITSAFDTISRLKELIRNLSYLYKQKPKSQIEIEKIQFVTPLSITPAAAVINQKSLSHKYAGENASYLETIYFPEGIKQLDLIALNKTYLPIINLDLSANDVTENSRLLDVLHAKYLDLLRGNIIADQRFLELITNNTFGFLLGEMFDNIQEHSQAKNVYVFAQYWPKTNFCELCILDDGQGIYHSLKTAGRNVTNSEDALRKVLETGLSAKTEFGDIKRGTGIRSVRAALTNKELNGEFFIMTGNSAFLHSASTGEKFVRLANYSWNGTIVVLRLNRPVSQFNLYDYIKT